MSTAGPLIGDDEASAEVRALYGDIRASRGVELISNFWRALANDPPTLRRMWDSFNSTMAPGALDSLTKELLFLAVSATNGCAYCTREAIPKPVLVAGYIFPSDFAIDGMVRIGQLSASLWEVVHDWRGLWGLAIIYFALAVISAAVVKRRQAHG